MPTTITPANTLHATLDCPLPKEGASASGMKTTLWQQLADNAEYARQLAAANLTKIPGQSVEVVQVAAALKLGNTTNGTSWEVKVGISNGVSYWEQVSIADADQVVIPIHLFPMFGKITMIGASICGGSGHSALPATMPTVTLCRRLCSADVASALTDISSVTDASATKEAYELTHQVTRADVNHIFAYNYEYYLRVTGEEGAGSEIGLRIVTAYFGVGVGT